MSVKALKACADYARLNAEIRRLSKVIGDCIDKCPGVFYREIRNAKGDLTATNTTATHLTAAFACDIDDDGDRYFLTLEEQLEALAGCPHCLAAHEAIQQRKTARKSLGATKRWITKIGKEAA